MGILAIFATAICLSISSVLAAQVAIGEFSQPSAADFQLNPEVNQKIRESYPSCSSKYDLTSFNRLRDVLKVAHNPPYISHSQPAIYSAILDAILTPTPVICTHDYVRLAYIVMWKEQRSSPEEKEDWALLKSRFQPTTFDLFHADDVKIMSVAKPGFALCASEAEIPDTYKKYPVVLKPVTSKDAPEDSFQFDLRVYEWESDTFLIRTHFLTDKYFSLVHSSNTKDSMVIMPTEDFVLGRSPDLKFRMGSVGELSMVVRPGRGFYKLGDEFRKGALFYLTKVDATRYVRPESLFYLA